jgi:hypothetical protein
MILSGEILAIEAAAGSFAIVTGSVAAFGEEPVAWVLKIENLLAFDVGFKNTGID